MVMLGLLSGPKTKDPLDLSQLLYKRLRIEGAFSHLSPHQLLFLRNSHFFFLLQALLSALAPSSTRPTSFRNSRRRRWTKSSRSAAEETDSTSSSTRCDSLLFDVVSPPECGADHPRSPFVYFILRIPTSALLPSLATVQVYDWEQIVEAHEEMEQAKNTGKLICTIGEQ
jgi:hypothetical protein